MKALSQGVNEVIALTSHFGFRDLVTLQLGQGRWMSNLTFKLVSCTWGKKIWALSKGVKKLSHLQASALHARLTDCRPLVTKAVGYNMLIMSIAVFIFSLKRKLKG